MMPLVPLTHPLAARPRENAQLLASLHHALDLHYRLMVQAARREWERRRPARDPSDACVSVRVTSFARCLAD